MNNKNQKLELTWIGKDREVKLEPRILVEVPEKNYGDKNTENMLIHGDNLLALKALEQDYAGKIKCIYIDPPYNTGAAFEHYDDNVEHSTWLSLMKLRLKILHNLLSEKGSIWISLDDSEQAYCRILCEEIFGRNNFITTVVWEKKYTVANDAKWFSDNHDFILVYAKNKAIWHPNHLPRSVEMNKAYKNPDNHPKGVWKATPLHAKSGSEASKGFSYTFKNGVTWIPPTGTYPRFSAESLAVMDENDEIWFGKDGMAVPARKTFLCDLKNNGVPPRTVWRFDEVGHNHEAREEVKAFNPNDPFATPKPERLIERVLTLGSNEGDLVLDSFLGSGTTAAVAHKMGRKWIGIELGDHCYTHCEPRLHQVVDGTDQGGISKTVNWQGGGGYKFYELAPSLLKKDEFGEFIIDKKYDAEMLAEAVAKNEGYKFSPDANCPYKQGYSSEKSFIFTTTQFITAEWLERMRYELKEDESILICTTHYEENCNKYPNITIKKIPQSLLKRCEFGVLDYNLNVVESGADEEFEEIEEDCGNE